jgi:hypothetical protein
MIRAGDSVSAHGGVSIVEAGESSAAGSETGSWFHNSIRSEKRDREINCRNTVQVKKHSTGRGIKPVWVLTKAELRPRLVRGTNL